MLEEEEVDVAGREARACLGFKPVELEEGEGKTMVEDDAPRAEGGCMRI
jgi:hypothetical protein